jgi:adenylylsulfate kinase
MVFWFTGLSASGKTTLANLLACYLQEKGLNVEQLDGDTLRTVFPNTGFSKEERISHIRRAGELAAKYENEEKVVVVSLISPYREARMYVRSICSQFYEIYIKASVETCEKRDPKGLYKKVRNGEISNFTGIDDPYEEPELPDVIIETDNRQIGQSFDLLRQHVDNRLNKVV